MPSHPSCAALRQSPGSSDDSAFCRLTTTSTGASRSMNVRAAVRSISWLSVSARSISGLARVHGARRLARGPADPDAPRHLHALDVGGAAGMDGDDAVALLSLQESAGRAPRRVRGERGGPDRFQDGAGHPEAGGLAVVRELRPLVRLRLARVREPEVPHAEQALHFGLDVDVGEAVADVPLLAERHAVALRLLAVAEQTVPHPVAADPAAAAVLELEVRGGDLPALVLAADQCEGGHAHVVEEDRLLDPAVGAALATGAHQLHRPHGDARQGRVDHEPREVLVAVALGVGGHDHPDPVGAVVAADEDLLPVDDVIAAVAHGRRHPHAREIGARARLGEELPGADLALVACRQERLPLLLGAPAQDRRRAEAAAAVVVRGEREGEPVHLFVKDERAAHPPRAEGAELTCSGCGLALEPDFAFCPRCGAARRPGQAAPEADRRQVTVLFADLSGFTALSERLDAERVRAFQNVLFETLAQTITRYDGFVEKFVGDAVLAVFGAPVAHEDDPARACDAALEMLERVAALSREWTVRLGQPVTLHVGIHTGPVVAGRLGGAAGDAYAVTGDTRNTTSRLLTAAAPGTILTSEATRGLAQHRFAFESAGELMLRGKTEPFVVHRLVGALAEPR